MSLKTLTDNRSTHLCHCVYRLIKRLRLLKRELIEIKRRLTVAQALHLAGEPVVLEDHTGAGRHPEHYRH
jgi:hypothetical protein